MTAVPARITRTLNNVRLHLPGVLDDVLKLEMYNVMDELLRETNLWQETLEVETEADEDTYELEPDENGVINRLMSLANENDTPVAGTMQEPGVLVLAVIPTNTFSVFATVSLTCLDPVGSDGWPRVPSWVWDKYSLDLTDGIVGRMMLTPAKPYSNEKLGTLHSRKFQSAIARARGEARRMNMYGAQRWRFPRNFA